MGLDTTHGCWHGTYSAFNRWRNKIAEMHQADLNRLATIEELVRCLENAIKFVYHYYGDDKEALADMETSTWRTIVKDVRAEKARTRLCYSRRKNTRLGCGQSSSAWVLSSNRKAGNATVSPLLL